MQQIALFIIYNIGLCFAQKEENSSITPYYIIPYHRSMEHNDNMIGAFLLIYLVKIKRKENKQLILFQVSTKPRSFTITVTLDGLKMCDKTFSSIEQLLAYFKVGEMKKNKKKKEFILIYFNHNQKRIQKIYKSQKNINRIKREKLKCE